MTDTALVPEPALFARLDRIAALAPSERARFAIQLRSPDLSIRQLASLGRRLRARTLAIGVRLFINDRLDLAGLLSADGIHLGRRSLGIADARAFLAKGAFVSVACHSVDEVVAAAREGATACTLSPIFSSSGKGSPIGTEALREARSRLLEEGLDLGIVALGGLDDSRAPSTLSLGADGVAVIRAEIDPALLFAPRSRETS